MGRLIRILVANQPKPMREAMLAVFARRPGVEIVGEVPNEVEISDRASQTLPNLLVVTMEDSGKRPAMCDTVLHAHPDVRIIAVSSRKNHGTCYWATLQIRSKNNRGESMLWVVRGHEAGNGEIL